MRRRSNCAASTGKPFDTDKYLGAIIAGDTKWVNRELRADLSNRDYFNLPAIAPRTLDQRVQHELDKSAECQRMARRQGWTYRIWDELRLHADKPCIFATLTLDDRKIQQWAILDNIDYAKALKHGWLIYKKRMIRRLKEPRHVATIERGTLGRLHIHAVWIADEIPYTWTHDPNSFDQTRSHTDIPVDVWPLGRSRHTPIRTSIDDWWGNRGHHWPHTEHTVRATNDGHRIDSPESAAAYIAKYVSKDIATKTETTYRWRTRATRGFGLTTINNLAKNMPLRLLRTATRQMPPIRDQHHRHIPMTLIRSAAKREIFSRHLGSRKRDAAIQDTAKSPRAKPLHKRLETTQNLAVRKGPEHAAYMDFQNFRQHAASSRNWTDLMHYLHQHLPVPSPLTQRVIQAT